jgi:hypothetical protein
MATAIVKIGEIQEVITTEVVTGVTLELTKDEVRALLSIFYMIGGSSKDSPRGMIDSIAEALLDHPKCQQMEKYGIRGSGTGLYFDYFDGRHFGHK